MKKIIYLITLFAAIVSCSTSEKTTEKSSEGESEVSVQGVWFLQPLESENVISPLTIKMAVEGMEVEPAGMVNEGKGHHHLIIDGSYVEKGTVVPADSTHMHFGKGQTEVEIELLTGPHTLTLQFADGVHNSYGKEWSSTIRINVENK